MSRNFNIFFVLFQLTYFEHRFRKKKKAIKSWYQDLIQSQLFCSILIFVARFSLDKILFLGNSNYLKCIASQMFISAFCVYLFLILSIQLRFLKRIISLRTLKYCIPPLNKPFKMKYPQLLYGKLRERAVCGEFYVLIGYPSGQDGAILPVQDCPFRSRK